MPQGNMKNKVKLPKGVKQKQGKGGKKDVLRKGHLSIAPKKSRLVQAQMYKKGLEKRLKASIEEKAVARASHSEPRSLMLLKSSNYDSKSKSKSSSAKKT